MTNRSGWARQAPRYGAVAEAVARERPAVVVSGCWCVSVQTTETTTSGQLGGMPLRVMLGYRPELVADAIGPRYIAEEKAVLAGARDLDPPERSYLSTVRVALLAALLDLGIDWSL